MYYPTSNNTSMYIFLLFIFNFILCFVVAHGWRTKGLSYSMGFWCSFFFSGIIGVLLGILFQPEVSASITKKCPQCSGLVPVDAAVCKFCGCKFDERGVYLSTIDSKEISIEERLKAVRKVSTLKDESIIPDLLRALRDFPSEYKEYEEDEKIRVLSEILKAIVKIKGKSSIQDLIPVFEDLKADLCVRKEVLKTLISLEDPTIVPHLLEYLRNRKIGYDLRVEATKGILRLGDSGIVPELLSILERGIYAEIREKVIEAIAKLGDASMTPQFLELSIADKSKIKILKKIGEPAIPFLKKATESEEKSIAELSEKVLRIIQKEHKV